MHTVYTAHIFLVCNSVICTNTFNILAILYTGHFALNYTSQFVYSQLNFIYIGYWTLNIYYYYISFLTVGSLDGCVSINCMERYFPIVCDHNRFYSDAISSE